MAVRVIDGTVFIDNTFESEIITLCQKYSNLYVVVMHQNRAGSALVRFYANIPLHIRKKLPMSKLRWEITFDNGSIVRFMAISDNERVAIPEPPVHILVNYGVVNATTLTNMSQVLEPYVGAMDTEHTELFPVLFDGDFLYIGEDLQYEVRKVKRKLAEEDKKMRVALPKKTPDVSQYPKAQEVLDEEATVMRVFEDELIQTKKMDLETKKQIRERPKFGNK